MSIKRRLISSVVLIAFCASLVSCSTVLSSSGGSYRPGTEVIIGGLVGATAGGLAGSGSSGAALAVAGGLFGVLIGSLIEKHSSARPYGTMPYGMPVSLKPAIKDNVLGYGRTVSSGVAVSPRQAGAPVGTRPGEGLSTNSLFTPETGQTVPTPSPAFGETSPGPAAVPESYVPAPVQQHSVVTSPAENETSTTPQPLPEATVDEGKSEGLETPLPQDIPPPADEGMETPSEVPGDIKGKEASVHLFIDRLFGPPGPGSSSAGLEDIFFGFEGASLMPSAKDVLDRNVQFLKKNQDIVVRIESFVGKYENIEFILGLALSERRGNLVRDYLLVAGISAERLTTKNFGRSMLLVPETLEDDGKDSLSARMNRRVHFEIETSVDPSGWRSIFE